MGVRVLAVLAAAIVAVGAFAITRPVIHPGPASAGAPITADGFSRFTPNGHEYFSDHGEIVMQLDHVASELALPTYGASRFALVPPLRVVVLGPTGTATVDDVAQVLMFTHHDRLVTIKLTQADGTLQEFRSENDD